jgi:predicted nucleic acid binding AN1-type Zn finger protein
MEFEHVGSHCQMVGCNQKDFLPFHCDHCKKHLCAEHRTYAAHSCAGGAAKDVTSIDCPVCGKTVKFDMTQDVNVMWEQHYLTECTQVAVDTSKQVVKKCGRVGCRTVLGISNTYTCQKCAKLVCLSHRIPEDHNCTSNIAGTKKTVNDHWSSKSSTFSSTSSSSSSNTSSAVKPKIKKPAYSTKEDMKNVLKETAHRRMPNSSSSGGSTANNAAPTPPMLVVDLTGNVPINSGFTDNAPIPFISCPLCDFQDLEVEMMSRHIANCHPHYNGPLPTVGTTPFAEGGSGFTVGRGEGAGTEMCPICQQRFSDAIELVSHCERVHYEQQSQGTGSSSGNSRSRFSTDNCRIG